jgi:hypothetical protein
MKKLIAIIAIVVLSTSFAFAATTATNNFKLDIKCADSYITGVADVPLGTVQVGVAWTPPAVNFATWDIFGDPSKSLTVTFTPPTAVTGLTVTEAWYWSGFDAANGGPIAAWTPSPWTDGLAGKVCSDGHGIIIVNITNLVATSAATSGPVTLTYQFDINAF